MLGKAIAMGLGMMFLTTIIHALFMVGEMKAARWRLSRFGRVSREVMKAVLISSFTAWMFLAIVIEAWLWAIVSSRISILISPMVNDVVSEPSSRQPTSFELVL